MDVQFTDREIDVMEVLWERGPSLVAEVQAVLKDELAYTTVLTVLRTLEGKGYVSRAELLFVHLVSDQRLSEKQIQNMRKLLESKSDTGKT